MIATDASAIGVLFADVQAQHIFNDQKTFVDAEPLYSLPYIAAKYANQKHEPDFDLLAFVQENFSFPGQLRVHSNLAGNNIDHYILNLWDHLTRINTTDKGSLIGLPHPYVAPGGRFNELYYWDSYFTMLGLVESGRLDLVEGMVDNFTYLIDSIGFIPNASRTYYLTRSQIPFYSAMVKLLRDAQGDAVLVKYQEALEKEYAFWMKGAESLHEHPASLHVVKMEDGSLMNRYWDTENTPRPEGYALDLAIMNQAPGNKNLYRNLRAACESGWDFSSRWLADGKNLHSICTTEIIPVDLNCMMLHLEQTLLDAYTVSDNRNMRMKFETIVAGRIDAIEKYLWDEQEGVYKDYFFQQKQTTKSKSLAMLFPLYVGISSSKRAAQVLTFVKEHLLKEGGLLTTNVATEQQWDAPKGWAPLQWVGYVAARQYGDSELATAIRSNWMGNVEYRFAQTGKLMEKYPVVKNYDGRDTGGEYPNQDGFGWTNGVYLKMKNA
ncbi:trehalase family glycosidase [Niabella sp. 22666]|uniref:trehalase family glycosidase n=1 Tax=Niabella sp. 22666 TaxID=3453954 RepID=UPI003F87BFF8